MRATKTLLLIALAIAIAGAVIGVVIVKRQSSQAAATREAQRKVEPDQAGNQTSSVAQTPATSESLSLQDTAALSANTVAAPAEKTGIQIKSNAPQSASSAPGQKPKKEVRDPDARVALRFVGVDPDAEQYWAEAIFDPSLPDHEREDLMEDLNEEGLSDPRHPSPADLQLIANRIVAIEKVAPHADQFMLPHLAEAYKDLWNLLYGLEPQ